MSKAASNSADNRLKKLRRLESNMTCPNCGTKAASGIGFGNVCVKFKTFICDYCKTSHQAISHRVKSITMSNWTDIEVNELMDENGGGNAACRHIWLGRAPPIGGRYNGGSRPREGDRIEVFKKFVMDCYDSGMFRDDSPYIAGQETGTASPSRVTAVPAPAPAAPPSRASPLPAARTQHALAPQPAVSDLVSFDDSFAAPAINPLGGTVKSTVNSDFDPFVVDPFGTNSSASSKPPASKSSSDFSNFPAANSTVSNTSKASTKPQNLAKAKPAATAEVNLLSYDEVPPPSNTASLNSSAITASNSLLDLLSLDSALPAAPPAAATPARVSPIPPTTSSSDPFGFNMLQPLTNSSAAAHGSFATQSAPPMRPMMSAPMGGPMGYAPRPPMAPAQHMAPMAPMMPGAYGAAAQQRMSPMPMMGGAMGAGAYSPMGGSANAISSLGPANAPMGTYRPTPISQQQDQFSFLQDTMRKHLENPNAR